MGGVVVTTKDYQVIASVMRSHHPEMPPLLHATLVSSFMVALKRDNPRFNETLFMEACRND